jgi:hypothetical protein
MRTFSLAALLLLLTAVSAIAGAPAKKAKRSAVPATAKPAGSFQPVNPASTWIQPGVASDFDALYKAKSATPKGEFETTESYLARISLLVDDNFYAVPLDLYPEYQADRQEFEAFLYRQELITEAAPLRLNSGRPGFPVFVVGDELEENGHYMGSNAFGAQTLVTQQRQTLKAVVLEFPFDKDNRLVSLGVPVALERARTMKVSFLLVFNPVLSDLGLTRASSGFRSPTREDPYEVTTDAHYISGGKAWVWAYDKATGEILTKIQIGAEAPPLFPRAEVTAVSWDSTKRTREVKSVSHAGGDEVQAFYAKWLGKTGLPPAPVAIDGRSRTLAAASTDGKHQIRITVIPVEGVTRIFFLENGVTD